MGAWSALKTGVGGIGKAVKFITTPVWLPAKTAVNFVKDHKLLTAGIAATAFVGIPAYKKMNHGGQVVDVGESKPVLPDIPLVDSPGDDDMSFGL